ncbi:MAG: hypothetical protein LBM05_01900 [Endomicrobium sp.]|jgi:hypothetical protein|nr:hypothetical protein [Endomicrobium sp.]
MGKRKKVINFILMALALVSLAGASVAPTMSYYKTTGQVYTASVAKPDDRMMYIYNPAGGYYNDSDNKINNTYEVILQPGYYYVKAWGGDGGGQSIYMANTYRPDDPNVGGTGGVQDGWIKLDTATQVIIEVGQAGMTPENRGSGKVNYYSVNGDKIAISSSNASGGWGGALGHGGSGGSATDGAMPTSSNKEDCGGKGGGGGGASGIYNGNKNNINQSTILLSAGGGGGAGGLPGQGNGLQTDFPTPIKSAITYSASNHSGNYDTSGGIGEDGEGMVTLNGGGGAGGGGGGYPYGGIAGTVCTNNLTVYSALQQAGGGGENGSCSIKGNVDKPTSLVTPSISKPAEAGNSGAVVIVYYGPLN